MTQKSPSLTIQQAIDAFIDSVRLARSVHTARTYRNAMNKFEAVLQKNHLPAGASSIEDLPEDAIVWLTVYMKDYAATTERLYVVAARRFYEFVAAEQLSAVNLPRVSLLVNQRARKPGVRLPQFPRNAIEAVIEYVNNFTRRLPENEPDRLRHLRDRAFLITLADTGLRVHEACGLRRGDVDLLEGRAIIIGKGNREAVVRFSRRSLKAIRDYLAERQTLDGKSGRALTALPLFARHDKGAGSKVKPISTRTGVNIVTERVKEALGEEYVGTITPHSFRHYFVTMVLRGSGNLKLAQELARHKNIAVTQRYAHLSDDELDRGYNEIFNLKS